MEILYTAEATAHGGREGRVELSDGVFDLGLAIPKGMGGRGGDFTNPEQLFAAAYSACFHSALKVVARRAHVNVDQSTVTARVGIGPTPWWREAPTTTAPPRDSRAAGRRRRELRGPWSTGYALEVELQAELPGVERSVAEDLVAQAHELCPYSNATRGNIPVTLTVA